LKGIKDERAFKLLLEIADTSVEYWPIKIKAMLLLGEIGNPKAIELLLKVFNDAFLNSECPSIKSHAAIALGHFNKDKRVVDALITGINDGEVLTREASVNSLGKIGNPKAVSFLIPALNDKSFAVRLSAVRALGKIGDPQAIPYLQKIAESDNDPYMKNEAISALKEMRR
jgi:HEAT repeat protein